MDSRIISSEYDRHDPETYQRREILVNTELNTFKSIYYMDEYRAVRYGINGKPYCIIEDLSVALEIVDKDGVITVSELNPLGAVYFKGELCLVECYLGQHWLTTTVNEVDSLGNTRRVKKTFNVYLEDGRFQVDETSGTQEM